MQFPLVCICVPTFNVASTVFDTLQSILGQTYPNIIVHVSDNASTDETIKIIESIADSRVIIHRHSENVGGEGNFNRCIQFAEGEYTSIFHADDIYEPDIVYKQVAFLESNSSAGAVFTEAFLIDELDNKIGNIYLPSNIPNHNGLYDFPTMFKAVLRYSNYFICPSVMVRTQIYQQEIKYWREDLFKSSADLDVWLRILKQHAVGYILEPLLNYRISSKQFSRQVRLGTEKADFFLVTDHYLAQEDVRSILDDDDLRNYSWLIRRDRLMRAINLFISNKPSQAAALLHDVYSLDALEAAIKTKQGAIVFLAGVYIKALIFLGLNKFGKISLQYFKQIFNK